jgi:hypothetical protein
MLDGNLLLSLIGQTVWNPEWMMLREEFVLMFPTTTGDWNIMFFKIG